MSKLEISLFLIAFAAAVAIGFMLAHENKIASGSTPGMEFLSFNRADTSEAGQIMAYWRGNTIRSAAIRHLVVLDFFLIPIYTLVLIGALSYRRKTERKTAPPKTPRRWMMAGLSIGMFCIMTGALLDVVQDGTIYCLVTSRNIVHSLFLLTSIKWAALLAGVCLWLISLIPRARANPAWFTVTSTSS